MEKKAKQQQQQVMPVSYHMLAAMALVLVLFTGSNPAITQANAQALCYSQFMLANEACSFVRKSSEEGMEHQQQVGLVSSGGGANPTDSPCCRRLTGIDNACVCGVLARLPIFITRPQHVITLSPANGCEIQHTKKKKPSREKIVLISETSPQDSFPFSCPSPQVVDLRRGSRSLSIRLEFIISRT
ncbi:hypothetical protein J5N97_004123 [Dioscorea zingiberensis]|uniref:Uncharacterized protein n=1 Tax=Dioscorea zingiberensis TaxID=325984 RepID=A0A9D5D7E1_9LILI|nr:hypothetical protein J5N97_004123 [Dioscorea zingiberensis]